MKPKIKDLMKDGIVVMPGAFNAISARLVEKAGFNALYISGAGLANGVAAMPDIGLLTMTEVLTQSKYIIDAVDIPCIIDGDTGFGEAINVMMMIKEMESLGAGGVHIEDQEMPKKCGHLAGKSLVSPKAMAVKIAAAVEARTDPDFLIVARTDARAVEGIDGAIKRANLYLEAGADAIFPEALESKEEFILFRKEISAPLLANMTEFGKSPYLSAKEFEDMGYNMVIFPLTAFRVMLKSVADALSKLKAEGTQKTFIEEMMTRKEIYEIIGYEDYEVIDKKISKKMK
ncbi:MAG: methylisocitrate lyase [Candidatus Scalindua sediminis]|nr:methylisocitrate lyase [Candidatus Scalindua sediminis]HDY67808.1 methylisocitrate lyase [Candidatus Scalindua sp.]